MITVDNPIDHCVKKVPKVPRSDVNGFLHASVSVSGTLSLSVLSHQEPFITFPELAFLTLFWAVLRDVTLRALHTRKKALECVIFALRANWISESITGQLKKKKS